MHFHAALERAQTYPVAVRYGVPILLSVVLYSVFKYLTRQRPWKGFPLIDLKAEEGLGPLRSWFMRGEKVIAKGRKLDAPFQVMTGTGPKVSLKELPDFN